MFSGKRWLPPSVLEAVLAMPLEEMPMGSVMRPKRQVCSHASVNQPVYAGGIIHLPRHKDVEIIGQADQSAIEHPMYGSGKSDAILDGVRPIRLDGSNMSRFDLRSSAAIDQL